MKVLLINPPFGREYSVGRDRSIGYVLNIIQPLGLAYLGAVLEKDGFEVSILDCQIEPLDIDKIVSFNPKVVGFTSSTPVFESARSSAKAVKVALPKAITVLGGAHITATPFEAMREGVFDIGVIGEGEETFLELVRSLPANSNDLRKVRGIIFREKTELVTTAAREFIRDLDNLPHPARHLLPPLSRYRPTPASCKRFPLATIMTSRGCPSQCAFCDRAVFGNGYRKRSAENVLAEVDEVMEKQGAREIRFFDDLFTLDKERASKICRLMRSKKIPWTCLTTVRAVNRELLKEMKASGCWQVLYGLESGDERMLALLKKGNTLEQNIQAVRWAKEAGLSVRADFIVGTPGETEESLKRTLDSALKMRLDYAHFNKFVPLPGTELYRRLKDEGNSFDFSKCSSITSHSEFLYIPQSIVDKNYYKNFINYAHRRFYLRTGYILRRLFSLRSLEELLGQIKGFFSIILLRERQ